MQAANKGGRPRVSAWNSAPTPSALLWNITSTLTPIHGYLLSVSKKVVTEGTVKEHEHFLGATKWPLPSPEAALTDPCHIFLSSHWLRRRKKCLVSDLWHENVLKRPKKKKKNKKKKLTNPHTGTPTDGVRIETEIFRTKTSHGLTLFHFRTLEEKPVKWIWSKEIKD
jgi:hypothetical protein